MIAHFGLKCSAYFVHQEISQAPRSLINELVSQCIECKSIEKSRYESHLRWRWLANDVTHVLSVVDCSPSHFGIWRILLSENTETVYDRWKRSFKSKENTPRDLAGRIADVS